MASLHYVLRLIESKCGIVTLRRIAAGLGVAAEGDDDVLVGAIHRASDSDLERVVGAAGGLSLAQWNEVAAALGGRSRPSRRAVARELRVVAVANAPNAAALRDNDPDAHNIASGGLPEAAFSFDPSAASQPPRDYQRELVRQLEEVLAASPPGRSYRITVATGGGKTRIANDWIWNHALPRGWRLLWVTKDWWLLGQAASDLCRRYAGARSRIGYVGPAGRDALSPLDERVDREVVFTTIHTWRSRRDADFVDVRFDVVVIDESHWGEGKRAYRDLHRHYRDSAVFLGLTATPRLDTRFTLVGRAYDYPTLVEMGVLARHIYEEPVRTGVQWSPVRSGAHGDFDRRSLTELASSPRRNRCVVRTYVAGRTRFGKTLMFACDIAHAETLAELLRAEGVAAAAVHSVMRPEDQRRVIARFRAGDLAVLVNVAMLTHGVDIADIETVFLARPTTSRTLFAQMVGRATRRTEHKSHFRLVDFVDNLDAHGDLLISPQSFFDAITGTANGASRYAPAAQRWNHEYVAAPFEHIPTLTGFEEIAGFDLQPAQTFGIEFELTRDDFDGSQPADWLSVAEGLLRAIPSRRRARKPRPNHGTTKNNSVWNVEWDASCGWEVTSRILSGASGFYEIVEVCRALDDFAAKNGLRVNARTGTHVHLGWKATARTLERLMTLVACFEPALLTLVAPSRSKSRYCRPIRAALPRLRTLGPLARWRGYFGDHRRRYLAVNPSHLFDRYGTLEVRLHSGTLEGQKILGWVSLWMRILATARGQRPLPDPPFSVRELPLQSGPHGDVRTLAEFVGAGDRLSDYLARRRTAVMERWMELPRRRKQAERLLAEWRDEAAAVLVSGSPPMASAARPQS